MLAQGKIVPPATVAEMFTPDPLSIGKASGGSYGLRTMIFQGSIGETYCGHAGELGHMSISMHWPKQGFPISVVVNTSTAFCCVLSVNHTKSLIRKPDTERIGRGHQGQQESRRQRCVESR